MGVKRVSLPLTVLAIRESDCMQLSTVYAVNSDLSRCIEKSRRNSHKLWEKVFK